MAGYARAPYTRKKVEPDYTPPAAVKGRPAPAVKGPKAVSAASDSPAVKGPAAVKGKPKVAVKGPAAASASKPAVKGPKAGSASAPAAVKGPKAGSSGSKATPQKKTVAKPTAKPTSKKASSKPKMTFAEAKRRGMEWDNFRKRPRDR